MPLLTLTWIEGRPHLEVDGKTIEKVTLATVEFEVGQQPVIQIEMSPDSVTVLDHGHATWIVTCPSCQKDSHHMCDLAEGSLDDEEDADEGPPEFVPEPSAVARETPLLDLDHEGRVVTVPQARIVDPSELVHAHDDFPF